MKGKTILMLAATAVALGSCSKTGKFTSDQFTVTPTPLEYVGGEVPATISVNVPAKKMAKKAVMTLTPVLRYAGGGRSVSASSLSLQGERAEANNQIISYRNGGHATLRTSFPFAEGMEDAELYMTFNGRLGRKVIDQPDVLIGRGTVCTAALVSRTALGAAGGMAPDQFQRVISQKQAATIKFLIAQSNLRGSELNSQTVRDFIATLRRIKSDEESLVLNNVEVSAYASPDGKYDFNERLAEKRGDVTEGYVKGQLSTARLDTSVDTKYTAEDWEGFQELVKASSLPDKALILRVLSMYEDPEQREREIQNVATVYGELAEAVLPELRRARLTINYDIIGRSDEQILETYATAPADLSVEELLYAANILADSPARKEAILTRARQQNAGDYRPVNNLAQLALHAGDTDRASALLREALSLRADAPEANANLALLALAEGRVSDAELYVAKAAGSDNYDEALGTLYIAQGKYNLAAARLEKSATNSTVLAQILAQDYAAARRTLSAMKRTDATTDYLAAVLAARMGDQDALRAALEAVKQKDAQLAQRAQRDLEFANVRQTVDQIVK